MKEAAKPRMAEALNASGCCHIICQAPPVRARGHSATCARRQNGSGAQLAPRAWAVQARNRASETKWTLGTRWQRAMCAGTNPNPNPNSNFNPNPNPFFHR
jgi:hypothetical protein